MNPAFLNADRLLNYRNFQFLIDRYKTQPQPSPTPIRVSPKTSKPKVKPKPIQEPDLDVLFTEDFIPSRGAVILDTLSSHSPTQLITTLHGSTNLKEENIRLTQELEVLRGMYEQLLAEKGKENAQETRLMLLKAQTMQLDRQVLLLTTNFQRRYLVDRVTSTEKMH